MTVTFYGARPNSGTTITAAHYALLHPNSDEPAVLETDQFRHLAWAFGNSYASELTGPEDIAGGAPISIYSPQGYFDPPDVVDGGSLLGQPWEYINTDNAVLVIRNADYKTMRELGTLEVNNPVLQFLGFVITGRSSTPGLFTPREMETTLGIPCLGDLYSERTARLVDAGLLGRIAEPPQVTQPWDLVNRAIEQRKGSDVDA